MNTLELDWCSCVFLLCWGGVLEHFYFSQMVVDLMEVIVCLDPKISHQGSLNLPMLGGNQTWCKRMVVWMDFPFNRVHSLGWCHLFMTPVKLDLKFKMRRTKNGSRKQRIASLLVRPSLQLGASEWPKLGVLEWPFSGVIFCDLHLDYQKGHLEEAGSGTFERIRCITKDDQILCIRPMDVKVCLASLRQRTYVYITGMIFIRLQRRQSYIRPLLVWLFRIVFDGQFRWMIS